MTMHDHPLDDLAPCALGLLEGERAREIETHAAACAQCATALGRYEATVAAMADAEFPSPALDADASLRLARRRATLRPPRRFFATGPLAAAAVLALAVGALGFLDVRQHDALRDDDTFLGALIASHFVHAQFRVIAGADIDAKVVYDRRGRWYEVIVRGIDDSYRIAVSVERDRSARVRPERCVSRGRTNVLAIETTTAFARFELRASDGRVVARAATPLGGAPEPEKRP